MSPGRLNRCWLLVLGIVLIIIGLIGAGLGTGYLQPLLAGRVNLPQPRDRMIGGLGPGLLAPIWQALVISVVGVVIGLLAIGWMIAQLPRITPSPDFRLHDDARTGTITVGADTIAAAAQSRLRELPGVSAADLRLAGTAQRPEATAHLKIEDRAAVSDVVRPSGNRSPTTSRSHSAHRQAGSRCESTT